MAAPSRTVSAASPPKADPPPRGRRRPAGRPGPKGSVGRDTIVESALALLRGTSPEKLTVVAVAAHARVDPALVRYYFGNKKGVLHAAAKRLLDQVQDIGAATLGDHQTFRERVRHRLATLIRALEEHPRFMQLVINEVYTVDDGGDPAVARDLKAIAERGLNITQALLAPEAGGPPVREVDPRYVHVAVLGLCTFFMDAKPLLDVLFGSRRGDGPMAEAYIDFATDLLVRGLQLPR